MKNLKSILASSLLAASAAVSVLSFGASASTYSSEPRDQFGLASINNSYWTVFMFNATGKFSKGTITLAENTKGKEVNVDVFSLSSG